MPEAEVTHFGIVTFCFNNIISNNKLLSTLFYQGEGAAHEVSLLFLFVIDVFDRLIQQCDMG